MDGLALIEPTDLYNLLNQGALHPVLSDPNYLLLVGKYISNKHSAMNVNE